MLVPDGRTIIISEPFVSVEVPKHLSGCGEKIVKCFLFWHNKFIYTLTHFINSSKLRILCKKIRVCSLFKKNVCFSLVKLLAEIDIEHRPKNN